MKKKLIFDTMITGHHLEYIHHLYTGIESDCNHYIFAIPETFKDVKNKFQWPPKKNIKFVYIQSTELQSIEEMGHLKKSYHLSLLLKKYALQLSVTEIFLVSLIDYYPLLPLFLPKHIKVSGIIYKIYLYEWKEYSLIEKIYESIRQYSIIKSANSLNIFILNDRSATYYLNKLWNTAKFKYLVDPYIPIKESNSIDIRKQYNIDSDKIIFLHMGAMEERKGTLEILKAISLIKSNPEKFVFIFAGKIFDSIKKEFYSQYEELKQSHNIILIDKFCDYELLASLSQACDCFLLPYKRVSLSSGILYYAAQFHKCVLATGSGLLGKLVRKNRLGYTLKDTQPATIASAILTYKKHICNNVPSFLTEKTIETFNNTIYQKL